MTEKYTLGIDIGTTGVKASVLDVTNPIVNTFDDPLTDVIALDIIPPVQDSAIASFNFFLLNNEIIFLFKTIRKILI